MLLNRDEKLIMEAAWLHRTSRQLIGRHGGSDPLETAALHQSMMVPRICESVTCKNSRILHSGQWNWDWADSISFSAPRYRIETVDEDPTGLDLMRDCEGILKLWRCNAAREVRPQRECEGNAKGKSECKMRCDARHRNGGYAVSLMVPVSS